MDEDGFEGVLGEGLAWLSCVTVRSKATACVEMQRIKHERIDNTIHSLHTHSEVKHVPGTHFITLLLSTGVRCKPCL